MIESLPLLLRDDRARAAEVSFEIRLTGEGGGEPRSPVSHSVRLEK